MIKNYLKIAFRNALRSPGFTFVNVLGLSLGIGSCLLISLFVKDELSFDNYHPHKDLIYRIISERSYVDRTQYGAQVPVPFAETLEGQFSGIDQVIEVSGLRETLFEYNENQFYENGGLYTDSHFFDFFQTEFLLGSAQSALKSPNSIVLTERLAIKYFGEDWRQKDVLSKSFKINNEQEYGVSGVVINTKENFHLFFSFLLPIEDLNQSLSQYSRYNWLSPRRYCYIKVSEQAQLSDLENQLNDVVEENINSRTTDLGYRYTYSLQPLEKIHLYSSHLRFDLAKKGNILYVRVLVVVAIFILLLACANFINISTARANRRAKEVGLRKVSGASKAQIIFQFLSEAFITAFIALIIGAFLVEVSLGLFNALLGKSLQSGILGRLDMLGLILLIVIFAGLIAGSYTAFYISSFQPARILKDQISTSRFARLRKVLVTFQFVISVLLIMGSLVVYDQLSYVFNGNMGYDREQVLILPIKGEKAQKSVESFRSALAQRSDVLSAAASYGLPGFFVQGDEVMLPERRETLSVKMIMADYHLIPTIGLNIMHGRNFSADSRSDELEGFIMNEAAVKAAGWTPEEALGKEVDWDIWISGDTVKRGQIIGVLADFHFNSLYNKIEPLVIHTYRPQFSHITLKLKTDDLGQTMAGIEEVYEKWTVEYPFQYRFLDESFNSSYRNDARFMTLLQWFTSLAVVIACLGLLGMAAYSAEQRKKEIGIRKVHGATVSQILLLINSQFMRLVIIAIIIGLPVGYYYCQSWLKSYSYHITLGWQQLAITGLVVIMLALITVSFQTFRASTANPIDTLKEE